MAETAPAPDQDKKPQARQIPFASHVQGLKDKISQLTENRRMGADLLFLNTYMASLAIANASRPEIFAYASNRKEYISAKYITKVDMYVKKWNYSYSEALGIVADRTNNPIVKSMLNRYANAIDSGVPDDDFLDTLGRDWGKEFVEFVWLDIVPLRYLFEALAFLYGIQLIKGKQFCGIKPMAHIPFWRDRRAILFIPTL